MQFTQNESCGKCVLCREGTKQMLALLDDIIEGRGDGGTLDLLDQLARAVAQGLALRAGQDRPQSRCSRRCGTSVAEYRGARVPEALPGRAGAKRLRTPEIRAEKCKGCTMCARKCPVGAISGERKTAPPDRRRQVHQAAARVPKRASSTPSSESDAARRADE